MQRLPLIQRVLIPVCDMDSSDSLSELRPLLPCRRVLKSLPASGMLIFCLLSFSRGDRGDFLLTLSRLVAIVDSSTNVLSP